MPVFTDFNPFISYDFNELNQFMYDHGIKVNYSSNNTILKPGDIVNSFYFIDRGKVRYVTTNSEGEEQVIGILKEGSGFGAAPLFTDGDQALDIFVITEVPTVLYKMNKDKFYNLIDSSEVFRNLIFKGLSILVSSLMTQVGSLSLRTCKERLYDLLLLSINKDSIVDNYWYRLNSQYTQNDMARIIGASRVTVAKLISELCEEGLIRIVNRKIEVKKSEAT